MVENIKAPIADPFNRRGSSCAIFGWWLPTKYRVYNSKWIECWISVPKAAGSNPAKRIFLYFHCVNYRLVWWNLADTSDLKFDSKKKSIGSSPVTSNSITHNQNDGIGRHARFRF